jgi:hypothetical protein
VAFVPQNSTQNDQFQAYIDYFTEKKRVGLAFLRNGVMYLIPPGPIAAKFYACEERDRPHMVGVFGDAKAAAA